MGEAGRVRPLGVLADEIVSGGAGNFLRAESPGCEGLEYCSARPFLDPQDWCRRLPPGAKGPVTRIRPPGAVVALPDIGKSRGMPRLADGRSAAAAQWRYCWAMDEQHPRHQRPSPGRPWHFGLSFALLLVAGCAHGPAELPRPGPVTVLAGEDPSRWAEEIRRSVAARPDHREPVVFLGSSSIRRWATLAEDMAPTPVVNHGFGGSKIFDAVYWLDTVLDGLQPRALVVFSGTNDIAGDDPREPEWIAERFVDLVERLRALGHGVPVLYISISPTPARERHLARVTETNRLIAARCAADPHLYFVDTGTALLDADGRPDPRWFVADRLHLNAQGYAAWTATIRPALARALESAGR